MNIDDETGFRGTAPFDAYSFEADTFLVSSITTDEGDRSLYLLDTDGNVVVEDDDSGGGLNSLIAHRTETGGEYTIIAPACGAASATSPSSLARSSSSNWD